MMLGRPFVAAGIVAGALGIGSGAGMTLAGAASSPSIPASRRRAHHTRQPGHPQQREHGRDRREHQHLGQLPERLARAQQPAGAAPVPPAGTIVNRGPLQAPTAPPPAAVSRPDTGSARLVRRRAGGLACAPCSEAGLCRRGRVDASRRPVSDEEVPAIAEGHTYRVVKRGEEGVPRARYVPAALLSATWSTLPTAHSAAAADVRSAGPSCPVVMATPLTPCAGRAPPSAVPRRRRRCPSACSRRAIASPGRVPPTPASLRALWRRGHRTGPRCRRVLLCRGTARQPDGGAHVSDVHAQVSAIGIEGDDRCR